MCSDDDMLCSNDDMLCSNDNTVCRKDDSARQLRRDVRKDPVGMQPDFRGTMKYGDYRLMKSCSEDNMLCSNDVLVCSKADMLCSDDDMVCSNDDSANDVFAPKLRRDVWEDQVGSQAEFRGTKKPGDCCAVKSCSKDDMMCSNEWCVVKVTPPSRHSLSATHSVGSCGGMCGRTKWVRSPTSKAQVSSTQSSTTSSMYVSKTWYQ